MAPTEAGDRAHALQAVNAGFQAEPTQAYDPPRTSTDAKPSTDSRASIPAQQLQGKESGVRRDEILHLFLELLTAGSGERARIGSKASDDGSQATRRRPKEYIPLMAPHSAHLTEVTDARLGMDEAGPDRLTRVSRSILFQLRCSRRT